jgi:hypothetical protein
MLARNRLLLPPPGSIRVDFFHPRPILNRFLTEDR